MFAFCGWEHRGKLGIGPIERGKKPSAVSKRMSPVRPSEEEVMKGCLSALILGIIVVTASCEAGTYPVEDTQRVAELAESVRRALPTYQAKGRILSHTWEVIQCDEKPSVRIAGCAAYRLLLREVLMEYAGGTPQAGFSPEEWDGIRKNPEKFPPKYTHIDLVLIPSGQERPIDLKSRIPWEPVEQRQFVCAVYLGEGYGFSWFGRMTLERQFSLREKLGLNGGDDPLQLAADGLAAKDPPTVQQGKTATFCRLKLEHAGEKAAPYLEKVIYEHTGHAARLALTALGTIPGERSTERLLAYYHSDDKELCAGAESGLCRKPYRVTAKDAYLDMLHRASREGRVHRNALEACIEFGWKKAMPALDEVCSKPSRYWSYRFAVEAKRKLQGKEVAAGPGYDRTLEEAKVAILACEDREIAVLWALRLVLDNPKGGAPERNQAGRQVVAQLPEDVSKPIVVHLAYNLQDHWERERIATLLELYPDNPDTEN